MNEKKLQKGKSTTKNTASNLVIVLLLATIIVSAVIGLYAWAKYRSSIAGNAEADVAKWNFNVGLKAGDSQVTLEEGPIDLVTTEYDHVASGKIAPGTSGEFDVIIDTSGTEVSLVYDVNISISNCPRNITFSKKGPGESDAVVISEGGPVNQDTFERTITLSKYVAVKPENQNEVFIEKIYWNWPYEADEGETAEEKAEYDKRDTEDQGKTVTMNITVTGTQVLQEPEQGERLADVVSVGDYVNYNAASGSGAGKNYTPKVDFTGISEYPDWMRWLEDPDMMEWIEEEIFCTFNSSDEMTWKVMSIDKTTGTVELMAENPTENPVVLYGKTGYKNAETVLNEVGKVYGYGNGADGGRSITVEDVNKLEGYTPEEDTTTSETYTSGTFIMDNGTEVTATEDAPVTMSYTASTAEKSTYKYYSYTTTNFSGKYFWLASRCLHFDDGHCFFGMRSVKSGNVDDDYGFYRSDGAGQYMGSTVLPVVSLKSNIQTSGQDESGAWNLIVK